jgi:hypothetical protein
VPDNAKYFPAFVENRAGTDLDVYQRAVLAAVLPLTDEPAHLLQAVLDIHIDALPVGSDDVIERQASELFLCVAERLLERGVGLHDASSIDFYEEDILCSLLDDRTVE